MARDLIGDDRLELRRGIQVEFAIHDDDRSPSAERLGCNDARRAAHEVVTDHRRASFPTFINAE
jgi:hypothetical protein